MKRFLITLGLILSLSVTTVTAEIREGSSIEIKDNTYQSIVVDGVTYVPARDIFEALWFTVSYNSATNSVTVVNEEMRHTIYKDNMVSTSVTDYIESIAISADGTQTITRTPEYGEVNDLSSPVITYNQKLYIPLREVLEFIGCKVEWNPVLNTTQITPNFRSPDTYNKYTQEFSKITTAVEYINKS